MDPDDYSAYEPDEVFNQPPALANYNLFEYDLPLREALHREGGGWIEAQAHEYGALLGAAEVIQLGELANRHPPLLRTHDRFGHRIDEVEFHPAWHELLRIGIAHANHSLAWTSARSGAHVARSALNLLRHQIDEGSSCPITMAFAVIPALRVQPELAAEWEPRVLSIDYDPRCLPAPQKRGALFGMAMTERQGGSDLRANTTRAQPLGAGGPGGEYALIGHKWFCSAPMSDAFLVLAQAKGGLSCFLLPRWKPDGTRNSFHLIRLKDKLGNRSNASAEVEFRHAWARLLGEEGRGIATIMDMVRHTRLDCACGSAATMRRAVAEATHHAAYRHAFGRRLLDQPLMRNVLADLCLESEASTALVLRLARGFDESENSVEQAKFTRIATAVAKYWITKRALVAVAESLECIGGNGYVEESPLSRLYRDVPLNSLWEGAGNVQCLDVLRAMHKDPDSISIFFREIRAAMGVHQQFDRFVTRLETEIRDTSQAETRARRIVEGLALALQGALLLQHAPAVVAEAFCTARLGDDHRNSFGTLPGGTDFEAIIERARPQVG